MKKRIITGAILLAVLIPVFTIEVLLPLFLAVMVILTVVGSFEMLKMFNKKEEASKPFMLLVMMLTVVFYVAIIFSAKMIDLKVFKDYFYFIDLSIALLLIVLTLFILIVFMPKHNTSLLSGAFITIFYIGLSFSSITILRLLGVRFVIYLFLITIMTDMFAYFIGSKFGKRKLAPLTSPKKSIEGAVAGSIAGTIFASLFALFFDIYPSFLNPDNLKTIFTGISQFGELSRGMQALVVVPVTLIATFVSQIGDLVASKFKRNYEIKDFGDIFPGHGGVVDRFDSAMLTSIFLVFLLTVLVVAVPLWKMFIF